MRDDIYLDNHGRFQMDVEELDDFIAFLQENEVGCDIEPADQQFHSDGHTIAFAKVRHPYDAELTQNLYHTWRELRASQSTA